MTPNDDLDAFVDDIDIDSPPDPPPNPLQGIATASRLQQQPSDGPYEHLDTETRCCASVVETQSFGAGCLERLLEEDPGTSP